MRNKKISRRQLDAVLKKLGYEIALDVDKLVYRHNQALLIVLPRMASGDEVRETDLLRVQNALAHSGLVSKEHFDALFVDKKRKNGSKTGRLANKLTANPDSSKAVR